MAKDDSTAPGKWPEVGALHVCSGKLLEFRENFGQWWWQSGWSCLEVVTGNWGYLMVVSNGRRRPCGGEV